MKNCYIWMLVLILQLFCTNLYSQVDESQTGAWYMYFWNAKIKDGPWGFQGDIQHRNWNIAGDLQQLMLRGGVTLKPKNTDLLLTLGYANITAGEFGDGKATVNEHRIYQEALLPQKVGSRLYLKHRFRYEQRFIENQDARTRWRYNIFINLPLNQSDLSKGALYAAFYNELFINGEKNIGDGRTVEVFGVNRTYLALGYSLTPGMKIQVGMMKQTTNSIAKSQIQLSLHHNI